jgi:hypothetical protein
VSRLTAVLVATVTSAVGIADAHVQPSIDDNDRYLKFTLMGDRVRLAYTVYFGEVPAAAVRRRIDANRDGRLDDGESASFGRRVAADVEPNIAVTIDGVPVPLAWAEVDVGLGTPIVQAGSFSIDMIAWLCVPGGRGAHELVLRDRYVLADPGEIELKVDPGLGVTVERITLGGDKVSGDEVRFRGGPPLGGDDGWVIAYVAGADAAVTADGRCGSGGATPRSSGGRAWLWIVGVIVVAMLVGGATLLARARARARAR